jgi:hypothetical protein
LERNDAASISGDHGFACGSHAVGVWLQEEEAAGPAAAGTGAHDRNASSGSARNGSGSATSADGNYDDDHHHTTSGRSAEAAQASREEAFRWGSGRNHSFAFGNSGDERDDSDSASSDSSA